MLRDAVRYLVCPNCGGDLSLTDGSVRCGTGHTFDVARQGYVNLLPGDAAPGAGDTLAMTAARQAFLGAGHYAPIVEEVRVAAADAVAVQHAGSGCVVDVGAGTGHYLAAVLDVLPRRIGLALDVSRYAVRRAARAHPRGSALVWDVWRPWPMSTGAAALLLNVFAPRNGPEMRRILHPDGTLIVVTPTTRHLQELVAALGLLTVDEHKQERLDEALHPHFTCCRHTGCEFRFALRRDDIETVVQMGPSAWHLRAERLRDRSAALPDPTPVTASVVVSIYHPR